MEARSDEATAYDGWADHYDLTDRDRSPFIEFYGSLLDDRKRAVLELGCGTGTILQALDERLATLAPGAARRLVGVDASVGMLRVARERAPGIEWVDGDMRTPPVAGPFDLVFCCFNTLQHLLRDEDLRQAFVSARDLLATDGTFAFDLYQPNEAYLRIERVDRMARAIVDPDGRALEIREDSSYDADARLLTLRWRLVQRDRPQEAPLARTGYRLRQYFPEEIERLLGEAGMAIRERFGDLDRSPFGPGSRKQVVVCARA